MTWNYRIISRQYGEETQLAIHEVYYDGDEPNMCSRDPQGIACCADVEEVKLMARRMLEACDKPVLKWEDF